MERGDLVLVKVFPEAQVLRFVWEAHVTYVDCCRREVYERAIAEGEEPDSKMGFPIEDVALLGDGETQGLLVEIKVYRYPNFATVWQNVGRAHQPLELKLPPGAEVVTSDGQIYYGFKYEPGPVTDWRWMLKQYIKLVTSNKDPEDLPDRLFSPRASALLDEVAKEALEEESDEM